VPKENFWTLWFKGKLTETHRHTIQLGATPSALTSADLHHSPIFYRPDALPDAQPTVSKTEGTEHTGRNDNNIIHELDNTTWVGAP